MNPIRQAIALEYGAHAVPIVTAKGDGAVADMIVEEARKQGIYVSQDPQLLALLSRLNVDDEILAIGDFRVRADQLAAHLGYYKPGEKVSVLIARRDKLERLEVTLGNDQPTEWQIEVRPDATAEQKQHLEAWLTGRS